MLLLPPMIEWLNALTLPLPMLWTQGPEDPEFGHHNQVGTVTPVPGGAGEIRQGAGEEQMVLLMVKSRRENRDKLLQTAREVDRQLRGIENALIWGTYVRFVFRQGTVDAVFEEPERDRVIANYLIETGV